MLIITSSWASYLAHKVFNQIARFKDCLPNLFHGFRNKYFNNFSLDKMLYFHN